MMSNDKKYILDKVLLLFKNYGVKSVSMDDISSSLNISKKTLYTFFESKNCLVKEAIACIFTNHHQKINRVLSKNISPIEKVILIYKYAINQLVSYDSAFFFELKKYHKQSHKEYECYRREIVYDQIIGLLKAAQKEGDVRKDVNLNLFSELHLLKLDTFMKDNDFISKYTPNELLNHLIINNLRGILTNPKLLK